MLELQISGRDVLQPEYQTMMLIAVESQYLRCRFSQSVGRQTVLPIIMALGASDGDISRLDGRSSGKTAPRTICYFHTSPMITSPDPT